MLVGELLERDEKVKINAKDKEGKRPFYCAVENNKIDLVKKILLYDLKKNEKRLHIKSKNKNQDALQCAIDKNFTKIAGLIRNHKTPSKKNKKPKRPKTKNKNELFQTKGQNTEIPKQSSTEKGSSGSSSDLSATPTSMSKGTGNKKDTKSPIHSKGQNQGGAGASDTDIILLLLGVGVMVFILYRAYTEEEDNYSETFAK